MKPKTKPTPPVAVTPAPTFAAVLATGPETLRFCGRTWQRGIPQPITADLKAAMLARGAEGIGFTLTTTKEL